MDQDSLDLLEQLKSIADKHQKGFLFLKACEEGSVYELVTPSGVTSFDLTSLDLMSQLNQHEIFSYEAEHENLISAARQLAYYGVQQRNQRRYLEALSYYRFPLFVACLYHDVEGMYALTKNIWILREIIKELLPDEGLGPNEEEQYLKGILEIIKADGVTLFSLVQNEESKLGSDIDETQNIKFLEGLRRIADFSGDLIARRTILFQVCSSASSANEWEAVLKAIVEELAQTELLDLLDMDGLIDSQNRGFREIWELYLKQRYKLDSISEFGDLGQFYAYTLAHYDRLRVRVTAAGAAFSHRVSYILSQFLQLIGRDSIFISMNEGSLEESLLYAEQIQARSMADWMCRTHPSTRRSRYFVPPVRVRGSMNTIEPAKLEEIYQAATEIRAPILRYMSYQDGYWVWLQSTDGQIASSYISDPHKLLGKVFQRLDYIDDPNKIGRAPAAQRNFRLVDENLNRDDLGTLLQDLYRLLVPPAIQLGLDDECDRLVIIADSLLEFVPFCALRTATGEYLIEKYEIVYWPSVTTWLLTCSSSEARKLKRKVPQSDSVNRRPISLVMGDPNFSDGCKVEFQGESRQINLHPLPGSGREAQAIGKMLGASPLLKHEATVSALFRNAEGIPVIHLATHGLLNGEQPEDSFLAFSDGVLTARDLYQYDPGIRAELVTLSACETGRGYAHPDSVIGLTNAFLIAGANTVVSTLWKISDDVTAHLITLFYTSLLQGENVAAALRKAQLEVLKDSKTRDPRYWAAFKLTGSITNPLEGFNI